MRNWVGSLSVKKRVMLGVLLLFLVVSLALIVNNWLSSPDSEVTRIKDIAGTVQSAVTVSAIVVGGILAYFKLQVFRDFEPHVDVVHDIRHRFMNDTYVHIDVRATLHNTSRVKIEFRRARFSILQVLPNSNDDIIRKHDQVFIDGEKRDIQWPVLNVIEHTWDPGKLIVEPGEKHSESQEFIVLMEDAETVRIDTVFFDPRFTQPSDEFGWKATAFYDTVQP